jgi:hypothetical protein
MNTGGVVMELKGAFEQLKGLQVFLEANNLNTDENNKALSIVFETLASVELNVVIQKIETLKSVFEPRKNEINPTHETLGSIIEQLQSINLNTIEVEVEDEQKTKPRRKSSFGQSLVNKSRNESS